MAEKTNSLEKRFTKAADMVGFCPLPDPDSGGTKAIEQIGLIRVEKQPSDYNYDIEDNNEEAIRFRDSVLEMLGKGLINETEANKLLEAA